MRLKTTITLKNMVRIDPEKFSEAVENLKRRAVKGLPDSKVSSSQSQEAMPIIFGISCCTDGDMLVEYSAFGDESDDFAPLGIDVEDPMDFLYPLEAAMLPDETAWVFVYTWDSEAVEYTPQYLMRLRNGETIDILPEQMANLLLEDVNVSLLDQL